MPKKYFTAEQIISKLREAEVLISQGKTAVEASPECVNDFGQLV